LRKKFVVRSSKVFFKDIDKLPPGIALEITEKLKILEASPLPVGKSRIKKLKGYAPPLYRLRVRDKRVLYRISGNEVVLLKIVDRKELEKELKNLLG